MDGDPHPRQAGVSLKNPLSRKTLYQCPQNHTRTTTATINEGAASGAEAKAKAKATQEDNAHSAAQQAEAQLTPFKKLRELRSGPRPYRFSRTGLSMEKVEHAHNGGWFHIDQGKEFSGSGDSTEKRH